MWYLWHQKEVRYRSEMTPRGPCIKGLALSPEHRIFLMLGLVKESQVIVLTLLNVGSDSGPFHSCYSLAPTR